MPLHIFPPRTASIVVTISSDSYNVNLKTLAGSPAGIVDVLCIVDAGVKIGSTSTSTPAFRTGGFASGSTVKIVNHGRIAGKGGDGVNTGTGHDGGPALQLDDDTSIDNTDGEIFGGGGGGGKGGNWTYNNPADPPVLLEIGGPGGGGQGLDGSSGGAGGIPGSGGGTTTAGGSGTETAPGGKGLSTAGTAGNGGDGGGWGEAGKGGGNAKTGRYVSAGNGTSGGAAGKAVDKQSHAVTWLGGNDTTHVKGAVS